MLEHKEKVAKSKVMLKVFQKLEHSTTALKIPFALKEKASCGKTMQSDSYWNVLLFDAPRQGCTD